MVDLIQAANILSKDGVVAVPSETVYGLAARIDSELGIDQIYTLKGRPSKNPLIVHFASIDQVLEFVDIDFKYLPALNVLWPGPLTFVAPLKKSITNKITAGLPTLAVRVPAHPTFLRLIEKVGPLAAPSANKSGLPSATRAEHVIEDYAGKVAVIEDPLSLQLGVESTILIQKDGVLHLGRLGACPLDDLKDFFSVEDQIVIENKPICPGQLFRHYAPCCKLVQHLDQTIEAIVGFTDRAYPSCYPFYSLGSSTDPKAIAQTLFETLRKLDRDHRRCAYIDTDFPNFGLYATITERLKKAIHG